MNKTVVKGSLRLFQTAYDQDGLGSIITVSQDAKGTTVTYVGYALLAIGMMLCSIPRRIRNICIFISLLILPMGASAAPKSLPKDIAENMGHLYIYHGGRIKPLSTLASDFTLKLCGSTSYNGLSAEQVFTGWLFYYDAWKTEPCIKIKDKASRLAMGNTSGYVALKDFFNSDGSYIFKDGLHPEANEKFALVSTAATGAIWSIFPYNSVTGIEWLSPVDDLPEDMNVDQWHFTSHCLNYLSELINTGEREKAYSVIEKIKAYQIQEAGEVLPSSLQTSCERAFMKLSRTIFPAIFVLVAGLILFFFPHRYVCVSILGVASVWILSLIVLEWIAGGRLPMANGYETMQWMALSGALGGVYASRRSTANTLGPICLIVVALALIVARMGQSNPQVSLLVPVLRSPLLSIHVLTVMIAYAGLAIMALAGAAWLLGKRDVLAVSRRMVRPVVFLLATGIFIGAVWANQSWGRYWGWDPKEVWALITMIVYSFPIHTATLKFFKCDRIYAIYTLVAFLCVLMTYFGVNFVLGGLHSYA